MLVVGGSTIRTYLLIAQSIGVLNKNEMIYLLKFVIRIEEAVLPPFIDHPSSSHVTSCFFFSSGSVNECNLHYKCNHCLMDFYCS